MTSRFALLTAVAGIIGLGCSGGDDGGSGTQPPAPTARPAFATGAQQPVAAAPAPPPAANTNTNTQTQTPVATGGTGGAPGASAAAGAAGMGAGGAPATTTGTPIPVGTGNAITPVAGHVAGTSNAAGIQGDFATFSDALNNPAGVGATTITPTTFAMAMGSTICVQGTASQVMTAATPDYSRYYGGGVSLTLADPGGGAGAQPWTRGKVVGFSFNITGQTIPAGALRFGVDFYDGATINHDSCKNTVTAGANTVTLATDLTDKCYQAGGATLAPTALLQGLKWQIVTNPTSSTPFNFCIESLTAIVSP